MGKRIRDLALVAPADDHYLPVDRSDLAAAARVPMGDLWRPTRTRLLARK